MNNNLINKDELCKHLNDCISIDQELGYNISAKTMMDIVQFVQEYPITYNVDKVIEQLSVIEDMADYKTYLKAIEIVKKGGIK